MNKKSAVSLSTNFIVILILAVVVLGLAVLLSYRLMGQSEQKRAELDQSFVSEAQRILAEGEKVAVYPRNIEIAGGKSSAIGIGILNSAGADKTFSINAVCNATISLAGAITDCNKPMVSFVKQDIALKNNEQKISPLVISINKNAGSGTYIINVEVKVISDTKAYDSLTHKVYVQVR